MGRKSLEYGVLTSSFTTVISLRRKDGFLCNLRGYPVISIDFLLEHFNFPKKAKKFWIILSSRPKGIRVVSMLFQAELARVGIDAFSETTCYLELWYDPV